MKKFLLSAVACLAVAGAASATDLYIRGGNFGWGAGDCTAANQFTDLGDGNFKIELETLSTGFKIADATWGADNWGSASNIELDKEYTLSNSPASGNISIKGGASFSNVTVYFNNQTGIMKCVGTAQGPDWATINMYLVGEQFGWEPNDYKMTWDNGVYTITVLEVTAEEGFKFSNPPSWQYHYGNNCSFEGNAADALVSNENDFAIKATRTLTNVTFTLNPTDNVITANEESAGVETLAAEAAGEAVYYNFQGVRVANPTEGMYIRLQAGKATKVIL